VIDGRTGVHARLDDVDSFTDAIRAIDSLQLAPADAVENAQRFSVATFQRRLAAHVHGVLERAPESAR
jgi:uncharacterized protein (DUF2384 family)